MTREYRLLLPFLHAVRLCHQLRHVSPLGLGADIDESFLISVAGAQEKATPLRYKDRWFRPHGRPPTRHIFKPQIGHIQTAGGVTGVSNGVENEFYCLKLMEALGLQAKKA